ncbi:MAG: hypothetical protein PHX61_06920 [Alphaproteobacteria bacterium]|nr:hypothetical protein [Alphaproteobacteria bacterium]
MSTNSFHQLSESKKRHDIEAKKLTDAICSLYMLEEDPYLKVMAWNVSVLDRSLFELENKITENLLLGKSNEIEMLFLNSQTSMWLDLVNELLTTWEARARKVKIFLSANIHTPTSDRQTINKIDNITDEHVLDRLEKNLNAVQVSLSLIDLLQENKKELKASIADSSLEYSFILDNGCISSVSRRDVSSSLSKFGSSE